MAGSVVEPWTPGDALRDAWVEFLSPYTWDWFCTMTFKDAVHPERADKAWRLLMSKVNVELYGRHWYRRPGVGVFWIRALEWQRRDVIHYHALVASEGGLNSETLRYKWHEWWFREFGRNQIEAPRGHDAVHRYVSKYVVKGGEIDLSPGLEFYRRQQGVEFPRR